MAQYVMAQRAPPIAIASAMIAARVESSFISIHLSVGGLVRTSLVPMGLLSIPDLLDRRVLGRSIRCIPILR